ncbi:MAG: YjbE family putative metal transport protein [Chloroflexi bacterium]|nr:YjbE family putative metal transport protein [Chloroflexota bacterium]
MDWDFIFRFLSITLIDLALSGDNAIVIGMAAASLPHARRKWAIITGGSAAIAMRIILTSIVTELMLIPLLSAVGGVVLIWVVYKLLKMGAAETEEEKKAAQAKNFRQAIVLILAADFMMSLDNIIAVAGTAHGNIILLIAGLLISMPLLMTAGGFVSLLIDRFKWLVYAGAFAITFTAVRMVFEDNFIQPRFPQPTLVILTVSTLAGIAIPASFTWFNRRRRLVDVSRQVNRKGS